MRKTKNEASKDENLVDTSLKFSDCQNVSNMGAGWRKVTKNKKRHYFDESQSVSVCRRANRVVPVEPVDVEDSDEDNCSFCRKVRFVYKLNKQSVIEAGFNSDEETLPDENFLTRVLKGNPELAVKLVIAGDNASEDPELMEAFVNAIRIGQEEEKRLRDENFLPSVLEAYPDIAKQVQAAGIDATAVIDKWKSKLDCLGGITQKRFAADMLKDAVFEANGETVKGLLVGKRDRNIPVLRSTGEHIEIEGHLQNWVYLGIDSVEIPFPCIGTLHVFQQGEYRGVPKIQLISAEKFEDISVPDTIQRLQKIAKSVSEVTRSDELKVLVVRGKIADVLPTKQWSDAKDWSQIWFPKRPVNAVNGIAMQIFLEVENLNQVRAIFKEQVYEVLSIFVEDFDTIAEKATKSNSDPVAQARFFKDNFLGREVIVVGVVTKVNITAWIQYDMSVYAIFDAEVGK